MTDKTDTGMPPPDSEVTMLLDRWSEGDESALELLLPDWPSASTKPVACGTNRC